jgi:hypothetical protein
MPRKKATPKAKKADPDKDINKSLSYALTLNGMEGQLTIIDTVQDLISNEQSLATIVELCSEGASIQTVEAALGISEGQLLRWLKLGRSDKEGLYRALYVFFSKANSGARRMAETALLSKNPEAWLKRCDMSAVLDQATLEPEVSPPSPPETLGKPKKIGNTFDSGLTFINVEDIKQVNASKAIEPETNDFEDSE